MAWLYYSPIPVRRKGVILLVQMISISRNGLRGGRHPVIDISNEFVLRTEVPEQLVVLDPGLAAVDENYVRILQRYKVLIVSRSYRLEIATFLEEFFKCFL
jgi:hypothetical protein